MATSTPTRPHSLGKLMAAGLIGSSIEWYDFFIYGTAAALVFGPLFFPYASPLIGTLLAFSTFWAGFIARPIGGLVFGHIGDRVGRKPALVTCLAITGSATFLIGVLPTAATIGAAAPILLVTLRFLQGIAVGGQWGGVTLLLTESARARNRGLAGSFCQMGVPIGVILGNVAFLVASESMSSAAFTAWGWRVPFLLSALLFPVLAFIQLRFEDTPAFKELQEKRAAATTEKKEASPLLTVIRTHWRPILLGSGLLFACNSIFYVSISGLLDYGTRVLHLERDGLLLFGLISSAINVGVILLSGHFSDRIGRRPLIVAGAVLLVLWAFPFFWLVDTASLAMILVAVTIGGFGSSLVYGPLAAYLSELFSPEVRYSGASMAYQLASILVSGGTPFLMTALLAATGTSASVSGFLALMALCTLGAALLLPETIGAKARPAAVKAKSV
ncbi:MFS transporter [Fodinicola acaciae]|uniref:MFS transporter n=1 Tax=Fodinicola acaciae TaxID=2681555 RepID=UPI0013D44B9D|nr:MFS transporter [Fodinicola acaciae]